MTRKERVIVFDGEDKFISAKGKPNDGLTPEGSVFRKYMTSQNVEVEIPDPADEKFCEKAEAFIKTNCNGKATPEQLWQVYELFQSNCIKLQEEEKKEDAGAVGDKVTNEIQTDNRPVFPDWETFDCDTLAIEIKKLEDTLLTARLPVETLALYREAIDKGKSVQALRCGITPPALPDNPVNPPVKPFVTLTTPNLGKPPIDLLPQPPAPEKNKEKSNLLIYVAVGLVLTYLITRKNK